MSILIYLNQGQAFNLVTNRTHFFISSYFSDYMATILKPALEREARERTRFEQTQNAPFGGGPSAVPRFRVATDEDKEQTLREQLARAEATMVASEPVHFYDLKETAARKTQELIEKDRQILHFTAYTLERVDNSQIENQRTRIMEFFYRISDGSLHVFEPPQANSGLYQVSKRRLYLNDFFLSLDD